MQIRVAGILPSRFQTFLALLDINYRAGFCCPKCPSDPSEWTIIIDGTTIGFKRCYMQQH